MQPIDPILVELIDSVDRGQPSLQAAEEWSRRSADYRRTVAKESDYSLSGREMQRIAELPSLLSELDNQVALSKLGTADPERLLGAGIRFFAHFSELTNDREATFFVEIPEFDTVLCAGKAVLEQRAEASAVVRRLDKAEKEAERLHHLFTPHADSFPKMFQENMKKGFGLLDEAFEELERYAKSHDNSLLDAALTKLNQGGQMVATFPLSVREMQQQNRRHVPLIGSLLETLEVDPQDEYLTLLKNEGLPQLRAFWQEKDDGWLLPPSLVNSLTEEVSSALSQVERSVTTFRKNPDAFWKSVKRLEDVFDKIRSNSMPVQNLLDSSLGPETSLILALLEGKAPDYAARSAVEAMRAGNVPDFITTLADGLEKYLQSKDKLVLLQMLDMLLEQI